MNKFRDIGAITVGTLAIVSKTKQQVFNTSCISMKNQKIQKTLQKSRLDITKNLIEIFCGSSK